MGSQAVPKATLADIVTRSMGVSTRSAHACRRLRALRYTWTKRLGRYGALVYGHRAERSRTRYPWHNSGTAGPVRRREWLARYGRASMLTEDKLRVADFLTEVQAVRAVPARSTRDPSGTA